MMVKLLPLGRREAGKRRQMHIMLREKLPRMTEDFINLGAFHGNSLSECACCAPHPGPLPRGEGEKRIPHPVGKKRLHHPVLLSLRERMRASDCTIPFFSPYERGLG